MSARPRSLNDLRIMRDVLQAKEKPYWSKPEIGLTRMSINRLYILIESPTPDEWWVQSKWRRQLKIKLRRLMREYDAAYKEHHEALKKWKKNQIKADKTW